MKIKGIRLILLLPLITSSIWAQVNHVLNYSFENTSIAYPCGGMGACYSATGVTNWYEPTSIGLDWFNSCNGFPYSGGMPQNDLGYQFPRHGISYAGLNFTDTANQFEYITGTLSDSLKANIKYCVTFYVSMADSEWWAISAIGAYFSNDSLCAGNNYNVLPYTPQIENPSIDTIKDKIDWVPISGEFTASGGEIFITIGDFYTSAYNDFDSVGHGGFKSGENSEVQTYYYIDDVYVRMLTIANAGKQDTICNGNGVVIGKDTTTTGVSFHWLPTAGLSNPNIAQPMASPTTTVTYTLTVVNDSIHGCNCADSVTKDSVKIVVKTCLGIDEINANNTSFDLYPNPNNGNFTFTYNLNNETSCKVMIYNEVGMDVGEYLLSSSSGMMQVNNPNLSQGVYFYKVYTSSGIKKVGKIIIVK